MTEIQDNTSAILVEEIYFYDQLHDINLSFIMKAGYNTVFHCKKGSMKVKLVNGSDLRISEGQLLLIPAYKIVWPVIMSDNSHSYALIISDKMLRSLLGNQINIWNKAIYLDESYLIDGGKWANEFGQYTESLFKGKQLSLYREILLSYMRTLLLIFCEELIRNGGFDDSIRQSTDHEKVIFNQFLMLLSTGHQRRQSVASCASELHITAKYLSTVCKNVSGKSPSKWITENIMEECYSLLRGSTLSIKEISNQLGFPNSSFFGQFFRKQAGVTPMEYRNEHKGSI